VYNQPTAKQPKETTDMESRQTATEKTATATRSATATREAYFQTLTRARRVYGNNEFGHIVFLHFLAGLMAGDVRPGDVDAMNAWLDRREELQERGGAAALLEGAARG
jgi:hypothetical protein